jgi:signal transduction histidine kinase
MTRMLDELLDMTRLEAGWPVELRCEPMDLVALAAQMVAERQARPDGQRLRFESAETRLVGVWDARRLERVLGNLLDNALKFSSDGVVVEVAQAVEPRLGMCALIHVRDQGVGIPAADLPRLFERFFRGSNVVGRIAGTGIGLAGARQIVEQHGGTLTVVSAEGVGSTFTVALPLPA